MFILPISINQTLPDNKVNQPATDTRQQPIISQQPAQDVFERQQADKDWDEVIGRSLEEIRV